MAGGPSIADAVNDLTAAFAAAGLESPRLDARILVAHVLQAEPGQLFARGQDPFPTVHRAALESVKARRLAREPVGRIRGYREFYSKEYLIGPATLEPRPDSETLVEAALKLRATRSAARVLDLGTGSGCLLIAILAEWPEASGVGVDIAPEAIEVARANAVRLGAAARARFLVGDWFNGLSDRFDLIVANPPYIATDDLAGLAPEVLTFDPKLALDGGRDGLVAYRSILPKLVDHLSPGGVVLLEVGFDQAEMVAEMCMAHGLKKAAIHHDLGGIARVVEATGP